MAENQQYVVEAIVGERMLKGVRQFKLKWLNWDHRYNRWTNDSEVDAPDLIAEFRQRQETKKENSERNKRLNWGVQPLRKAKHYPDLPTGENEDRREGSSSGQDVPTGAAPPVLSVPSLIPSDPVSSQSNDDFLWPAQSPAEALLNFQDRANENSEECRSPVSDPDVYSPLGITVRHKDSVGLPTRFKWTTPRHAPPAMNCFEELDHLDEEEYCLENKEQRSPSPFSMAFQEFRKAGKNSTGKSADQAS